jgi:chemotaxis response regulator CheB
MPRSAMEGVPVDYCLRTFEIGPKLLDLVSSSASKPAPRPGRIMIVEDDALISGDLERQLSDLGYQLSAVAVSGEEALRKARLWTFGSLEP